MQKRVEVIFGSEGKGAPYADIRLRPSYGRLMDIESEAIQRSEHVKISRSPSGAMVRLRHPDEAYLRDIVIYLAQVFGWKLMEVEDTQPSPKAKHRAESSSVPVSPPTSRVAPQRTARPARVQRTGKPRDVTVSRIREQRGYALSINGARTMSEGDVRNVRAALGDVDSRLEAIRSPAGGLTIGAEARSVREVDGAALNAALVELAERLNWNVINGSIQGWS